MCHSKSIANDLKVAAICVPPILDIVDLYCNGQPFFIIKQYQHESLISPSPFIAASKYIIIYSKSITPLHNDVPLFIILWNCDLIVLIKLHFISVIHFYSYCSYCHGLLFIIYNLISKCTKSRFELFLSLSSTLLCFSFFFTQMAPLPFQGPTILQP